jgi:protein gp37
MGENSNISWCHHTFNPWIGCAKVSDGCKHCYAEGMQHRFGGGLWGSDAKRRLTADSTWRQPLSWDRKAKAAGERHRVFCSSLADVFEDREDLAESRRRLLQLIEQTPHLDWLLLTKRPHDMARLARAAGWFGDWPSNVWAGATVEHQKAADARIHELLRVPARIHFLSCEPMLSPIRLTYRLGCHAGKDGECNWQHCPQLRDSEPARSGRHCPLDWSSQDDYESPPRIDWVIVGGESGPNARPFDLLHAGSLVRQCKLSGVPVFFKQLGASPVFGGKPWPLAHDKRTGADTRDWPEWAMVQEVPR